MTQRRALGWYTDEHQPYLERWWNGRAWTNMTRPRDPADVQRDLTAPAAARLPKAPARLGQARNSVPTRVWIGLLMLLGIPVLVLLLTFGRPVLTVAALAVLITAAVALFSKRKTWLRFRSRAVAGIAVAASVVVLGISGAVSAATTAPAPQTAAALPLVAERIESPTPTPTPTPTRVVTTRTEMETEAVAFERTSVDDATIASGQSLVTTAGVEGVRTKTFTVTLVDGVVTTRVLTSDTVTTPPVAEVTSVGTYVEPAPQPAQPQAFAAESGCDPNYAEGCVPIDSDVDCGGGSGDGPSYFWGTARVVGRDIYQLDRDKDGWACNS